MADRQYIVKAAEKDVIAELTDELLPGFMQGRCEAGNGYFSASSDSQWQEQNERLKELNAIDSPTGAANRETLYRYLEDLIGKKQGNIGVFMLDIDSFKAIVEPVTEWYIGELEKTGL